MPMNDIPVKKGRGCFFYGCLTLVVVFLVGVLAVFFGVRHFINQAVEKYTDTTPMSLPKVEISMAEANAAAEKVKAFKTALDSGVAAAPLALTEKELNALIANSPDFAELKDRVYVAIAGDQLKGQVSIPIDRFPIGRTKGRYLNGAAGIKVSMENGVLLVTLQSLEVKGEPVPEQFLSALRQQNLAQEVYKDVQRAELLRKLESVEVKDDALQLKARAGK